MTDNLLLISTSASTQLVAIQSPRGLLERAAVWRRGQPRTLLRTIHELLDEAQLARSDLSGLICDVGPGSFTGIRLGLSTARTLAWALAIPTFAVCSLDAMLHDALQQYSAVDPATVAALLPSRRGVLYAKGGPWPDAQEVAISAVKSAYLQRTIDNVVAPQAVLNEVSADSGAPHAARVWAIERPAASSLLHIGLAAPPQSAHLLLPIYAAVSQPERLLAERAVGDGTDLWPNSPPSK